MATSAKQRQKKLEKKVKKRKQVRAKQSKSGNMLASAKSTSYAAYPVHECLVPSRIFETGIGTVIFSRKIPNGEIAVSSFVVDTFCLGVKDAFFTILSEVDYENKLKSGLFRSHEGQTFDPIPAECGRQLIEGAIAYAEDLGFAPHLDYKKAKGLLGNEELTACTEKYTYGKDGKPFYIKGPHETEHRSRQIVEQLHKRCGEGGYHFMMMG